MSTLALSLNTPVLVLNKHWMAVRVTNARRAFSLLICELAEVINVDDRAYTGCNFEQWSELSALHAKFDASQYVRVRTVRSSLVVPKIIRLFGYDRLPRQNVKLNRRNIFARDHNQCQYCGQNFPTSELSLDHINPRSQGGGSSWKNLVCCCVRCNTKKGGRTPVQANMKLIRKPIEPKRNPAISMRLRSDRYACWQAFLDNAYWSVELK